jgi:hypothetical protein
MTLWKANLYEYNLKTSHFISESQVLFDLDHFQTHSLFSHFIS